MRMNRMAGLVLAAFPALLHAGTATDGLAHAIRASDYEGVQRLLAARGADPNRLLADGSTPLSWAVETQDARMVRLLLDAKARPDAARNAAAAPLLLACEHGEPQILTLLLDAGADVTRGRPDGIAPLALCAGTAPVEIVRRLLAGGAAVDRPDASGQTALMRAAARGRIDNLHALIAQGADVNRVTTRGFTPLFFALKSGNPAASLAVLEAGGNPAHVGPEGTTAVQLAMYQKDHVFATRMVERDADLGAFDRNGNTLLHAAVLADQPSLVKLLLARGADPNTPTAKPRVEWRYEANFRSGDVVLPAKSPLLLAAERGSAESLRLLAEAGADPAFRLEDGTGIAHAAVAHERIGGDPEALAMALRLQPDPNVTNAAGQTPLHLLLASDPGPDTDALMRLLAASGARTDIADRRGHTAADVAADAGTAAEVRTAFQAAFGAARATASGS
jgi:ankyrin repeat protein